MFLAFLTFICFGVALNLFYAGATGILYEFWSGGRGGARVVSMISSLSVRLLLSLGGALFLVLSLCLGYRALNAWAR